MDTLEINLGSGVNAGDGEAVRSAFQKTMTAVNALVTALPAGKSGKLAVFADDLGNLSDGAIADMLPFTQQGAGATAIAISDFMKGKLFTPEQFGAKGDTVRFKDTITIAGNVVTFATPRFSAATDVGKVIALDGCGYYVAKTASLGNPGNGYGTLPTLTLVGGTSVLPGTCYATGPGPAAPLTQFNQFRYIGKYSAVPANPVATTSSDGGAGAALNITAWRNLAHRATITAVNSPTSITLDIAPIVQLAGSSQAVVYGSDDTAAINRAFAAALLVVRAGQPAAVYMLKGYTITTPVAVALLETDGRLKVVANYVHAALTAPGTALKFYGPGDQAGKTTTITADAVRGQTTLTVANGGGAVAKGDTFWLTARNYLGFDCGQSNRAVDVNGNVVILERPLYVPVTAAYPTVVQVWKAARNFVLDGLVLDGLGCSAEGVTGLLVLGHRNPAVTNVKVQNFVTAGSEGWTGYEILGGSVDVDVDECGGDTTVYGGHFAYTTGAVIAFNQINSYGFGGGLVWSSGNWLRGRAEGALGRGFKIYGSNSIWSILEQYRSGSSIWTGVAIESGSSFLDFIQLATFGNSGQAVWSDGSGCVNNRIRGFRYGGNGTDLAIAANDTGWLVEYDDATPPVYNDGSNVARVRRAGSDVLSLGGPLPSGRWYGGLTQELTGTGTVALAADTLYAVPFIVCDAMTFVRIAMKVTIAAAAGTLIRLGIYGWANGAPTSLIVDAGTIPADAVGLQAAVIAQKLAPGAYCLVCVTNGTPTVNGAALLRNIVIAMVGLADADIGIGSSTTQMTRAFPYAALPASWGTPTDANAAAPFIFMRQ